MHAERTQLEKFADEIVELTKEVARLRRVLADSDPRPDSTLVFQLGSACERMRSERDQARAVCAEWEAWLDKALAALGVETVFDIPETGRRLLTDDMIERGAAVLEFGMLEDRRAMAREVLAVALDVCACGHGDAAHIPLEGNCPTDEELRT